MKLILMIMLAIGFTCVANAKMTVKSKDYSCSELKELVQEEGTVHIKWIGSVDVHSSPSACNYRKYGRLQVPYQTTWRTTDKWFCVAGYSCKDDPNDRR